MKPVYSFDDKKSKLILAGHIQGAIFVKKVEKKKHFMRKYNGYGISIDVIENLRNQKIDTVFLHEGKSTYVCSLQTWMDLCKIADEGHGRQAFLNPQYMEKVK